MAKIYILLPVHNRREVTRDFVACLKAQTAGDFHLVLMDDGSTDGTADMVRENIPDATVLRGNGDWWWAGSLQRGLDWLKENVTDRDALILFINDDVRFHPDYLARAEKVMAGRRHVLMLSRLRSLENGNIGESGITADMKRLRFEVARSAQDINCLSTRGLFIHWGDVQAIGDFYPRLLPHYLSDYEYTMRARRKGFSCETSAELVIEANQETTGYHSIAERPFRAYMGRYFSKKSPGNPVYWSSFVMLTCSPLWIVLNLARIWAGAARNIFRAMVAPGGRPC
ncbi:MAG TPA: glycosyltransferase [Gallionellaceae bacterium]|nr:glycosyltransferase [Gallionellaceae bacterium]